MNKVMRVKSLIGCIAGIPENFENLYLTTTVLQISVVFSQELVPTGGYHRQQSQDRGRVLLTNRCQHQQYSWEKNLSPVHTKLLVYSVKLCTLLVCSGSTVYSNKAIKPIAVFILGLLFIPKVKKVKHF